MKLIHGFDGHSFTRLYVEIYDPTFTQIKRSFIALMVLRYVSYFLSYLHVFIEQHHQDEAEKDAGGHHARQEGSEEFVGDDAF